MTKKILSVLKRSRIVFITFLLLICTFWSIKAIPLLYPYIFYIPILFGGYFYFVAGGLTVGAISSLIYVAIVFISKNVGSPAEGVELFLHISSFNLIGLLVGLLSGRSEQSLQSLQRAYVNILAALGSALDARDHYTRDHSERVAKFSIAIGEELKLPPKKLQELERAARLHDLGKIGIPDETLNKVDEITEDEFEEIKLHVLKGVKILAPLKFLGGVIKNIRHHHEWYNGKGYPNGVKGKDIELGARIIAVADAFDAMTAHRPYRTAFPPEEAVKRLKESCNTQFDPQVVEAFLRALEKSKII